MKSDQKLMLTNQASMRIKMEEYMEVLRLFDAELRLLVLALEHS